jgi:hypothetical protein
MLIAAPFSVAMNAAASEQLRIPPKSLEQVPRKSRPTSTASVARFFSV